MLPIPWNLPPSRVTFHPANVSRTGGPSLNNSEQVVQSNSGHWAATLEIPVYDEERVLAYQAFIVAAEGRSRPILVPFMSRFRPRDRNGRMFSMHVAAPMWFSEGAAFGQMVEDVMWVRTPAKPQATRLYINHPQQPPLRPGQHIGIGYRLYRIAAAWTIDLARVRQSGGEMEYGAEEMFYSTDQMIYGTDGVVVEGENVQALEVWPPLREPVPANTPLILGRPVCKMRFSSDETGALDLDDGLYGRVTLEFREVY